MNETNTPSTDTEDKGFAAAYGRWAVRNRFLVLFIILAATIAAAIYVPKINMRNDPDTLLPASNRYVATNSYSEDTFGMGNLLVFSLRVKEGNIYQPWFVNMVQKLHQELVALPTSRKANFIDLAAQKIKYMGADENGLVFKRLIPTGGIDADPAVAKEQLAFLKEGIETNPVLAPMLVYLEDAQGKRCKFTKFDAQGEGGCEAKAAFVIADYTDGVKDLYRPWVTQVREIRQRYMDDPRVEVHVAGEPYFLGWMLQDLVNKWWLFVISIAIVAFILWYEFRHWRGAVLPLVGVGSTIIMTMGVMGFSDFKLTTMMVLTPMLLLAIGVGHSVQVTRRFMQEQGRLGDCKVAAEIAIGRTIIPATLAIATDMVGFATLATVDISFYKAYAYFGMFGMLTLLLTTTTMIPLLMTVFPCSQAEAEEHHGWEASAGSFLTRLLLGPGKWIPIAFVAVLIGVSTYYSDIKDATSDDLMPGVEKGIDYSRAAFKKESDTIQDLLKLNQIMPGVISVTIPIRGKEPLQAECMDEDDDGNLLPPGCYDPETMGQQGIFNDPDVLADIEFMEDWLRANPAIGFTGSYAQYVKLVNMLLARDPSEPHRLSDFHIPTREYLLDFDPNDTRDPKEIVPEFNGLLENMTTPGDMDSFVDTESWNRGVIMGFINTMDPKATHEVAMDIQQYVEDHKNSKGFSKVYFGLRDADTSGDANELSVEGPGYVRPGLGGFLGATEATREVAYANWLSGPLLTAAAIFLMAALMLRSALIASLLVSLLLITLYAQYGMGGYFTSVQNWSGNLAFHLQVALSIAMGLGVDYGIYMVSRLREEMRATGGNWEKALENTQGTTGSAVIISVVVLISCFIPLLNTSLANTWGLAIYIIEALLIDVVTALLFLPLLVRWTKPKYVFGPY